MAIWDIGPFEILSKLRHLLGVKYDERSVPYGTNIISKGLVCPRCNSVWIGVIITVLYLLLGNITVWLCLPFALSGVVVLILEGK